MKISQQKVVCVESTVDLLQFLTRLHKISWSYFKLKSFSYFQGPDAKFSLHWLIWDCHLTKTIAAPYSSVIVQLTVDA